MDNFLSSLNTEIDKIENEVNNKIMSIFETVSEKTIEYTPQPSMFPNAAFWATGHLVNQWYPAINDFSNEVNDIASDNGNGSLGRVYSIMKQKPFKGKDAYITLTNNVDYAYRAEAIGWPQGENPTGWKWSGRVQPYFMVSKAIGETAAGIS